MPISDGCQEVRYRSYPVIRCADSPLTIGHQSGAKHVIDTHDSFWTVPEHLWPDLWVLTRWIDFPDPGRVRVNGRVDTECRNVAKLTARSVDAEYGFRSLTLYRDERCTSEFGVAPLLLDVDLDSDERPALDSLLARIRATLNERGWRHRVYSSGEGYHIEIDPASTPDGLPCPPSWWIDAELERLRAEHNGKVELGGGRALIDKPHTMMRMVGSRNRKGGLKRLV